MGMGRPVDRSAMMRSVLGAVTRIRSCRVRVWYTLFGIKLRQHEAASRSVRARVGLRQMSATVTPWGDDPQSKRDGERERERERKRDSQPDKTSWCSTWPHVVVAVADVQRFFDRRRTMMMMMMRLMLAATYGQCYHTVRHSTTSDTSSR